MGRKRTPPARRGPPAMPHRAIHHAPVPRGRQGGARNGAACPGVQGRMSTIPALGLRHCLRAIVLAGATAALAGCQQSHTFVLEQRGDSPLFEGVVVRPADGSTGEHGEAFERALAESIAGVRRDRGVGDEPSPAPGPRVDVAIARPDAAPPPRTLTVEYRIVHHDAGSPAARVGAAIASAAGVPMGALGEGVVAVDVAFKDDHGRVLSRVVADGPIDGPIASTRTGLENAARAVARYTRASFEFEKPARLASLGALPESTPRHDLP